MLPLLMPIQVPDCVATSSPYSWPYLGCQRGWLLFPLCVVNDKVFLPYAAEVLSSYKAASPQQAPMRLAGVKNMVLYPLVSVSVHVGA